MAQKMGKIHHPEQSNGKLTRLRRLGGVYVLQIEVPVLLRLQVGVLSELAFSPGIYCYVGSAQNNLEKRIARHLKQDKKRFWHIDYLLAGSPARVVQVYYKQAGKSTECLLAHRLSRIAKPVQGFGASDCACGAHLFQAGPGLEAVTAILELECEALRV